MVFLITVGAFIERNKFESLGWLIKCNSIYSGIAEWISYVYVFFRELREYSEGKGTNVCTSIGKKRAHKVFMGRRNERVAFSFITKMVLLREEELEDKWHSRIASSFGVSQSLRRGKKNEDFFYHKNGFFARGTSGKT